MKPGQKTTEFAVTAAVIIGNVIAAAEGSLSDHQASVASVLAGAAYAISRGIAKRGAGGGT
jgi:hypothetical protein